jgi:hypothetical protein
MSNEWKRSVWSFKPVSLSHTYQNILNAIDTMMTNTGWVLASWSGVLGVTNYYVRSDRLRLDLEHSKYGPSGNQTVTVSGANLSKSDLANGAFGVDESTKASGYVEFTGQPANGDTVTITDGVVTKTFEFNTGAVTPGNIKVVIGSVVENTIENLQSEINNSGTLIVATPHWHWWYTGDNYYQHCGIKVSYAANLISISSFLENNAKTGNQITCDVSISIAYDITKDNNFSFIIGEDGFYIEGGTDDQYNNIAHGMVFAYYPDKTLNGTRDRERTWSSQGVVYELRGNLRSYDRNMRFVETVGDRRNHTGRIVGRFARGSDSTLGKSIANNRDMAFGPRDHFLNTHYGNSNGNGWAQIFYATLGLMQSNFDDIYRVSKLMALQGLSSYYVARNSGGSETVGAGSIDWPNVFDIRNGLREIPKFGCCSSYLLPWNNVIDKRTNITYRVAQVVDGGRNSNLCIIWPNNSNVVTIPATP